ncbi:MFS transporter [Streptacidiphilus sp. 4-A2]|nr:MFS transporter [Streptacidiphilus sp. 4-A2]
MGYLALLRAPHVTRLLFGTLLGRLPAGMTALVIALALRDAGAPYSRIGLATAAYAIAAAVGGPVLGRIVDRTGQPRVLLSAAVVAGLGYALLALAPGSPLWAPVGRRWQGWPCRRWNPACARCGRPWSRSDSSTPPTPSTRPRSRSSMSPGRWAWPAWLPGSARSLRCGPRPGSACWARWWWPPPRRPGPGRHRRAATAPDCSDRCVPPAWCCC